MNYETVHQLVIIAAFITGAVQVYRVIIDAGGSPRIIGAVGWLVVILISVWQLRRSPG
jgi:hypothetical protein